MAERERERREVEHRWASQVFLPPKDEALPLSLLKKLSLLLLPGTFQLYTCVVSPHFHLVLTTTLGGGYYAPD